MACILDGTQLTLTGDVGDYWLGDGFSHGDVVLALAQVDDDGALDVFINSGGGIATEGAAIHALLARRAGETRITVDGVAASAASLITMAGSTITMSPGSVMMIHDPAGFTLGNSAEHAKAIEALEALGTAYARVYASRSGKTPEAAREIMRAERWFTPEQAVAEGFADQVAGNAAQPVAAFDYRKYAHAPDRLVAMARAKSWTLRASAPPPRPTASTTPPNGEATMPTDAERADALAAELETMRATMAKQTTQADADELKTLRAEKADRERRDAVMSLAEARGREGMAEELAKAGVTADAAKAVLAAAPVLDTTLKPAGPEAYERARMAAGAGLNGGTSHKKGDPAILKAAVDRTNARR